MSELENVGPVDPTKRTSQILPEAAEGSTEEGKAQTCYWNGQQYGHGAELCSAGSRLRCYNGSWLNVGSC